jgi:hypothetical protein
MNTFNPFSWLSVMLCLLGITGCSHLPSQNHIALPNKDFPYSFNHAPFISPRIVRGLSWIDDREDQVVAINISESRDSNRNSGDAQVRNINGQKPFIYVQPSAIENGNTYQTEFGYQFVGMTSSGITILLTSDWGGGTGVFKSLLLVAFEYDKSIRCDWDQGVVQTEGKRLLIKRLGEIPLGDRWDGELKVNGNSIFVGKDNGWFSISGGTGGSWLAYNRKDRVLKIALDH